MKPTTKLLKIEREVDLAIEILTDFEQGIYSSAKVLKKLASVKNDINEVYNEVNTLVWDLANKI